MREFDVPLRTDHAQTQERPIATSRSDQHLPLKPPALDSVLQNSIDVGDCRTRSASSSNACATASDSLAPATMRACEGSPPPSVASRRRAAAKCDCFRAARIPRWGRQPWDVPCGRPCAHSSPTVPGIWQGGAQRQAHELSPADKPQLANQEAVSGQLWVKGDSRDHIR